MKKIRIGVICPSEIAFRRFMPALNLSDYFEYAGVAFANADEWCGTYSDEIRQSEYSKAKNFQDNYGGEIYESYSSIIADKNIDAVYLPLPPAFHYEWGVKVLMAGKHLFLEKPSTVTDELTKELIDIAVHNNLAVHENYMFMFHSQLDSIQNMIDKKMIGEVRLFRLDFGFPKRASNDFRYNKKLGGGALLDAGGYTVKLASILLGDTATVVSSTLNYIDEFDVDVFGTATIVNEFGLTAQLSFGMDNSYKCNLEVWGSKGTLFANRIFTAPVGFEPVIEYKNGNEPVEVIKLESDDTFLKSINHFYKCIIDKDCRQKNYFDIIKQSEMVECIKGDT